MDRVNFFIDIFFQLNSSTRTDEQIIEMAL